MKIEVISPYPIEYATDGSAAVDLRAYGMKTVDDWFYPEDEFDVGTGVYLNMVGAPVAGIVIPRSGLGSRGLVLRNGTGLIDSDYQGEIILKMAHYGTEPIKIKEGDRIAQMFFIPIIKPVFEYVKEFSSKSDRGGFGSTGLL